MGKKYIVELEDKNVWTCGCPKFQLAVDMEMTWVKLSPINTGIPLTPYTEPDVERVKVEAYEQGYEVGAHDAKKLFKDDASEAYQKGLNDAWDAARKIGNMPYGEEEKVFGSGSWSFIAKHTAAEAIEKIRQYEQEQEEIKVGDEVNGKGGKGIIARISDDGNYFNVMWENGSTGYYMMECFKKTGRHFPEIAEVLKKMQEG